MNFLPLAQQRFAPLLQYRYHMLEIISLLLPGSIIRRNKRLLPVYSVCVFFCDVIPLLDLSTVPTRASLIADLTTNRVQNVVPTELVTLYEALELDFQPLKLAQRVQPALQRIGENEDLSVYLEPLQELTVSKTLLQLSQVYRSLRFDELVRLCPFYDPLTLERCVVELIYNLELPMRVDHRRSAIIFDVYIDLGISQRDYSLGSSSGQVGG